MTDAELLSQVKIRLGITGTYHDDLLTGYITDVKLFLTDAGVPASVLTSNASVGVIARGVSDSWNFGSGDGKFSQMFYQRAEQLRHIAGEHDHGLIESIVERLDDLESEMNSALMVESEADTNE